MLLTMSLVITRATLNLNHLFLYPNRLLGEQVVPPTKHLKFLRSSDLALVVFMALFPAEEEKLYRGP